MTKLQEITDRKIEAQIWDLANQGAIFYVSHSGGKDSQATYLYLSSGLHISTSQIVVVHADLGEVEWTGVKDHIRNTILHPLNVVSAIYKDGSEKTLLNLVEKRFDTRPEAPSWPSSAARYCTSDLKRGPIEKFIRNDLKARGKTLAVNVCGIRAEESSARAKKVPFQQNDRLSIASRTVYDWYPIFDWSTDEVFQCIADYDEKPFWAYAEGNDRLSCVFCVFGSKGDIARGRKYRPELFAKYVALEEKTGYSVFAKESIIARSSQFTVTVTHREGLDTEQVQFFTEAEVRAFTREEVKWQYTDRVICEALDIDEAGDWTA